MGVIRGVPSVLSTGDLIPYGPDAEGLLVLIVFLIGGVLSVAFVLTLLFARLDTRRDWMSQSALVRRHAPRALLLAGLTAAAWLVLPAGSELGIFLAGLVITVLQLRQPPRA